MALRSSRTPYGNKVCVSQGPCKAAESALKQGFACGDYFIVRKVQRVIRLAKGEYFHSRSLPVEET
jgi:hypothetical protein